MTFSGAGLWTSDNTTEFYNFLTWLMGQAAPAIMMLFAAFVMFFIIKILRDHFLPGSAVSVEDGEDFGDEEDDED